MFQFVNNTPTRNEWKRFKRYAARVVELVIGGWRIAEVAPETISFFGMRSTLDPLWPRLTSLRLADGLDWNTIPSILMFLSPKITTLALTLPRGHNVLLQPMLSIVADKCRWLRELVLSVGAFDSQSNDAVGRVIIACRDTLRTLDIRSPFVEEHRPMIADLPQLRSLKLWGTHASYDPPPNAFPNLEEVIIPRFHGSRFHHFFRRLGATDLKIIKIHGIEAIAFKKSMAELSRFSTSLEILEISGVGNLDLPGTVVPPLLFASLRTLYVGCLRWDDGTHHGPCVFEPTDQAIAELGASIPIITHLTLGSWTCPNFQPVTFLSLTSLSKACRDLETLTIKIDLQTMVAPSISGREDVDAWATFDRAQESACKLRRLVVGSSTLPDHPDSGWVVAGGLGRIFPSLSEVVGSGRDDWGKVGRNIKMLRQVVRTVQQ